MGLKGTPPKTMQSQIHKHVVEGLLVCPSCMSSLLFRADEAECSSCGRRFYRRDEIWDFTVNDNIPNPDDAERWQREELQDVHRAWNYWLPLFRKLQADRGGRRLRVLSVGCGVAADVDQLNDAGFECYGVDSGKRSSVWSRRAHAGKLLRANGMHVPFPDAYFDIVFAGCLFPHVGAVGDSFEVQSDYRDSRLQVAKQMVRVCRPGGAVVVSCPNRLFPLDLFHRGGSGYMPRVHGPTERFLLSLSDFRKLFVQACGCRAVRALPTARYWTFNGLTRSSKGRVLASLIHLYLRLVSMKSLSMLRGSLLAPWLVIAVER